MRITFLVPAADMTGGARVIHIYASRLKERGHDVTVIARAPKPPTFRDRLRIMIKGQSPRPSPAQQTHYRRDSYDFRVLSQYRPIGTEDVPNGEVVIATWWETAEWMMLLPPTKGKQAHFVQGYEAYDTMPKERVDAVLSARTSKITISQWLEQLLRSTFHNDDVEMIPNSVDMDQFHAPMRSRRSQPTVGMLYSTVGWKDCKTGFQAFELFRERLPNSQLVTFGSTHAVRELPLPRGTCHATLPDQDDLREIYAKCDVWFCPSTHEGFHLPPLEAMACRCPVISTRVGGPMDVIVEGENGFFVPIGDAEEMAATLERFFCLGSNAWQKMSDAAYATAVRYSWDDATDRFEQCLLKMVAEKAAGR